MIRQNDNEELPIGTQRGCLTITSKRMGYKEYFDKAIQPLIEQCKHEGGAVNWNERTTSVYPPDDVIERYHKNDRYYQCQCKCGQICYMTEWQFLSKRHRYCGSICGRKLAAEKRLQDTYKRVKDENYDVDFTGAIHESLEVLECVDDYYEVLCSYSDKRKKGGGTFKVYKLYKCRCYLCGKEQEFKSSDFTIRKETYGYTSIARCDCHGKVSSFQWRTIDMLEKHHLNYRVEFSFPDLFGVSGKYQLRFDFAILNGDNEIEWLLECQGQQHYEPTDHFYYKEHPFVYWNYDADESKRNAYAKRTFARQTKNDQLKRDYAIRHNLKLLEIPYSCNTYEKEEQFLRANGVI